MDRRDGQEAGKNGRKCSPASFPPSHWGIKMRQEKVASHNPPKQKMVE